MLVNHPNMCILELDPINTQLHAIPVATAAILAERMGDAMFVAKDFNHWYAKVDGLPIHLKQDRLTNYYYLEANRTQTQQVNSAIMKEIQNGIITAYKK